MTDRIPPSPEDAAVQEAAMLAEASGIMREVLANVPAHLQLRLLLELVHMRAPMRILEVQHTYAVWGPRGDMHEAEIHLTCDKASMMEVASLMRDLEPRFNVTAKGSPVSPGFHNEVLGLPYIPHEEREDGR